MSSRWHLLGSHIFLLDSRHIWLPNKTKSWDVLLEFEWLLPLCSWMFDMFESIETMSATLKLYKLHPWCGGSITLCKLHRQFFLCLSNIHARCPLQALAIIWETMCNYDKSACYVLAIFKRGSELSPWWKLNV